MCVIKNPYPIMTSPYQDYLMTTLLQRALNAKNLIIGSTGSTRSRGLEKNHE
jgi:hypothetical protein